MAVLRTVPFLEYVPAQLPRSDRCDSNTIAPPTIISHPELFTDGDPKALPQMVQQRAGDRQYATGDVRGSDKENGHRGVGRGEQRRYSKKVFILSKNPSPSVSRETPLSLANSVRISLCLFDSFVGIWIFTLMT